MNDTGFKVIIWGITFLFIGSVATCVHKVDEYQEEQRQLRHIL